MHLKADIKISPRKEKIRNDVRSRMAGALRRIARDKAFEAITVREISRESGLSTRTFYNNFRSKYDLVLWNYAHADYAYLKDAKSAGKPIPFGDLLLRGLERLSADRALFKGAFTDRAGPESLSMTLVEHGCKAILEYIRIAGGEDAATERTSALLRFYVEGTVSELARWMAEANPSKAEEFRDFLMEAMPGPLKGLLSEETTNKGKSK